MIEREILEFDEWCDIYGDIIDTELEQSGISRELDFNPEAEYEKRYQIYLDNCQIS